MTHIAIIEMQPCRWQAVKMSAKPISCHIGCAPELLVGQVVLRLTLRLLCRKPHMLLVQVLSVNFMKATAKIKKPSPKPAPAQPDAGGDAKPASAEPAVAAAAGEKTEPAAAEAAEVAPPKTALVRLAPLPFKMREADAAAIKQEAAVEGLSYEEMFGKFAAKAAGAPGPPGRGSCTALFLCSGKRRCSGSLLVPMSWVQGDQ